MVDGRVRLGVEWNAGAPAAIDSAVKAEDVVVVPPRCVAHTRCCATPLPPGPAAEAEIFRTDADAWNPLAAEACFSSAPPEPSPWPPPGPERHPLRKRVENDGALAPRASAASEAAATGVDGALRPRASSTSTASAAEAMFSMAAPAL